VTKVVPIGTLAVDGWAVTFGTASIGLGELRPRPIGVTMHLGTGARASPWSVHMYTLAISIYV